MDSDTYSNFTIIIILVLTVLTILSIYYYYAWFFFRDAFRTESCRYTCQRELLRLVLLLCILYRSIGSIFSTHHTQLCKMKKNAQEDYKKSRLLTALAQKKSSISKVGDAVIVEHLPYFYQRTKKRNLFPYIKPLYFVYFFIYNLNCHFCGWSFCRATEQTVRASICDCETSKEKFVLFFRDSFFLLFFFN